MSERTTARSIFSDRPTVSNDPTTSFNSKEVMLRAERHDRLLTEAVHERFEAAVSVPDELSVTKRTNTYYGPELQLSSDGRSWMLTAPGPDTDLLLWRSTTSDGEFIDGWSKIAEVTMEFADEQPQYDLCPYCGDPLRTLEHERQAATGDCL